MKLEWLDGFPFSCDTIIMFWKEQNLKEIRKMLVQHAVDI